jgi:parallel beta-helix repeat protein
MNVLIPHVVLSLRHNWLSRLSWLALAMLLSTLPARAGSTYYVSPTATATTDLTNDGSKTAPITFDKAFNGSTVKAGDTVYVRGGVYRPHPGVTGTQYRYYFHEVLRTNPSWTDGPNSNPPTPSQAISGTPAQMITVQAYGDEKPILKGSLVVSGTWTQIYNSGTPTNIWRIDWNQPDDYNSGAGHSDQRFSNCQQVFVSSSDTVDGIALRQISWPATAVTSEQVVGAYYGIGNPANSMTARPDPSYNTTAYDTDGEIVGDNMHPGVMTQGSFFYDHHQHKLYVWLPNGNAPGTTGNEVIEASSAQSIALFDDYYHVKGLAFRHSNSVIDYYAVSFGAHCLVENCDIQWSGGWGVGALEETAYIGCVISNNGQMGAGISTANQVFRDCLFKGNNYRGYARAYGGGLYAKGGHNSTVENCEFTANFGTSVRFIASPENDLVRDATGTTTDFSHLQDVDSTTIIRNNYIHDNVGYPVTIGMDVSTSSYGIDIAATKGASITNNILLENTGFGITITDSSKCSAHDNIIASTNATATPNHDGIAIAVHATHRVDTLYDRTAHPDEWIYLCDDNQVFDNIIVDNGTIWIDKNTTTTDNSIPSLVHNILCDYNIYFRTGGSFSWYKSNIAAATSYTTLPAWTAAVTYDAHSVYADPGFAAQGGLASMIDQWQLINRADPSAPGVVQGVGLGISTDLIQGLIFDGLVTGFTQAIDGSTWDLGDANLWIAPQRVASGFNWEAGPSTGTPAGDNLTGGFLYRADTGQTYARNWLLTGDAYDVWGDYGLFVSTSNTGAPKRARFYHDGIGNRTTIGHNTDSRPAGTDTLNIEGTTSLIPPQTGSTGTPTSRVVVLGTQTTNSTVTELTTNGATPDTSGNTNRIVLSYDRTATITANIVGRQASTGTSRYVIQALYVKGNGSSLTLSNTASLSSFQEAGASTWGGFSFDVSGNVVRLKVAGATSTTINWSATVEVTEVGN